MFSLVFRFSVLCFCFVCMFSCVVHPRRLECLPPSPSPRLLSTSALPEPLWWLSCVMMRSEITREEFMRPQQTRWWTPCKGKETYMYIYRQNARKRQEKKSERQKGKGRQYNQREPPLLRGSLRVSASAHTPLLPFFREGAWALRLPICFSAISVLTFVSQCAFFSRSPSPLSVCFSFSASRATDPLYEFCRLLSGHPYPSLPSATPFPGSHTG